MMGRRENGQGQFFYSFDLDEVVPPDHLVRQIDSLLDLSWVDVVELGGHDQGRLDRGTLGTAI
jgi:hypothetical protein